MSDCGSILMGSLASLGMTGVGPGEKLGSGIAAAQCVVDRRSAFRALIVEDDDAILRLVKKVLEREGFHVEGVHTATAAIALLDVAAYDLLILDLILPTVGGEAVLAYLGERQPNHLRRVVVTTASPRHLSCEFLDRICRILEKPFNIDDLILIARECGEAPAA